MDFLTHIKPKAILNGHHELVTIDLTEQNLNLDPLNPGPYVHNTCEGFKKTGIGGYLEKRKMYEVSELFKGSAYRNIHLGIDVWQSVGTQINMPITGEIHSFNDNDTSGDYGPTIITKHSIDGQVFHLLFGHLSRSSLKEISIGKQMNAGECLGYIGDKNENGHWPPHLHFQMILDMQDKMGDYPGVAFENELSFYSKNCPDPSPLIKFD